MIQCSAKIAAWHANLLNLSETLARIAEVRFPHVTKWKEGGKEKRSGERAFVRAECQAIRVAARNDAWTMFCVQLSSMPFTRCKVPGR